MVEVLFWLVLIAYILYVSQVLISLIYWGLCLTPWCISFRKPTTMGVRSVIKLDLLSNIVRLGLCSIYPLYLLWGAITFSYESGILNIMFIFFVVTTFQVVLREGKTLDKDYEDVMPNFVEYFKYGLFRFYRLLRGYLDVKH